MRTPEANETFEEALRVARMYYTLELTTEQIARQLGVSRSTVSRLLSWAKAHGVVEVRIIDHRERQLELEGRLERAFDIPDVKVVPLPAGSDVDERLASTARFTAHYLNSLMEPDLTLALAWGDTVAQIAHALIPKPLPGVRVVQMNGSGNSGSGITYAADIMGRFAENYGALSHPLPVPAYFDRAATKEAIFAERTVARLRELAARADIALYSIGVPSADSYLYRAGYLRRGELDELLADGVVGDIATVFFREDGSCDGIELNERSSGPPLAALRELRQAICVVVGERKRAGILGALRGRFLTTLIIDEPTALTLLDEDADEGFSRRSP